MLVPLTNLHVRLRGHFRRDPVHVFPMHAFSYTEEVESDLLLWSEPRGVRQARLRQANQLVPAPQHEVLGYVAGRSRSSPVFLFAHPRWIPLVTDDRPLSLDTASEIPPRFAADLAMEQGCAPDSHAVQVLREDFEAFGGISHLALYERGRHRFLTIKRHNLTGGSGAEAPRFLATGAGLQREQRGSSVRELLPPAAYRLRLIVAVEAPWDTACSASQLWKEWAAE